MGRAILFVKDFHGMLDFYRSTLGLQQLHEQDTTGWAELGAVGSSLALHAIPEDIAGSIAIADPALVREETPIKLVFLVPDVESERRRLVSLGVSMSEVSSWGTCDGLDPEGNVFQIAADRCIPTPSRPTRG